MLCWRLSRGTPGNRVIKTVVVASYRGYTADVPCRSLTVLKIIVVAGFLEPTDKNLSETFTQGDENLIKSKATVLIAAPPVLGR